MRNAKLIHGDAKRGQITRLRRIWKQIKTRCYNPRAKDYQWYGGKGIAMCNEWANSYITFKEWALSAGYTDELTIDRIDSEKGYEPNNCRWVTMTVQNQNKQSVPLYVYKGETHCVAEWARILGIKREVIKDRVGKLGWDFARAVETPVRKFKQH